jgi:hypothetical protein
MKTKNLILLLIILVGIFLYAHHATAQRIKSSKVDQFTGSRIIATEAEHLAGQFSPLNKVWYQLVSIDGAMFLHIDYQTKEITTVREDGELLFLLDGGSVVKFLAVESRVAQPLWVNNGWALTVGYTIANAEDWILLETARINKIRIQMPESHVDFVVKEEKSDVFNKAVELFDINGPKGQ